VAKRVKKTVRDTKDAIRDLRHNRLMRMDEEEQRIAKILRAKNKDGGAKMPEAIKEIIITAGTEETSAFERQNDHLRSKGNECGCKSKYLNITALNELVGLPNFTKMERSIGSGVYLWTQSTFDSEFFITTIQIHHSDVSNPHYKDPIAMKKEKFLCISHAATKLQFWVKTDKRRSKGSIALFV